MKKLSLPAAIIFALGCSFCSPGAAENNPTIRGDSCAYRRIVSLAPSVTEILFDLGLGERVVGVTRYCNYPLEARGKTRVGGYVDPNYEGIVRLEPDLVIMLTTHAATKEHLRQLGLKTLTIDHTGIAGIIASITTIGSACGAARKAECLVHEITARMDRIRKKTDGCDRPRVLVSVDRNADVFNDVYIAGKNTCYDEMVSIAGGVNAYGGSLSSYPVVSIEGICRLNPEVVIDLLPQLEGRKNSREKILAQWGTIRTIEAVRNRRIYLLEQDYAVIPGPRFIDLLEDMARAIHPELR
jgi:iron complex transport system substrate-binding protein